VAVRVLTLNLANISEPLEARSSALVAGLKQLRPDIVCFQEVSPHPRLLRVQSEIIAEQCNFSHHAYSFSGCWGTREEGLAILSRYPIVGSLGVALPEFPGDMARQVFISELRIGSRAVLVANTHLAFPLHMTRERSSQAANVVAAIEDYRDRSRVPSVVICGDFNDAPDSPAIRTILASNLEVFDAFAACNPGSQGHTFSAQNRYVAAAPGEEGRIDYIFAGGKVRPDGCEIVFDGRNGLEIVSDHFGLLATLAFE
jgi:endonuclease/exonuclease/phosphatase family metal-dependent hydrolase